MTRVELYEEPTPAELSGWQTCWLALADRAIRALQLLAIWHAIIPGPVILAVVLAFLWLCHKPPSYPTYAAFTATWLDWFLMMTPGRWLLRVLVAGTLLDESGQLLLSSWYVPNPLKA